MPTESEDINTNNGSLFYKEVLDTMNSVSPYGGKNIKSPSSLTNGSLSKLGQILLTGNCDYKEELLMKS